LREKRKEAVRVRDLDMFCGVNEALSGPRKKGCRKSVRVQQKVGQAMHKLHKARRLEEGKLQVPISHVAPI
jgi:hypothetical protein